MLAFPTLDSNSATYTAGDTIEEVRDDARIYTHCHLVKENAVCFVRGHSAHTECVLQ